MPRMQTSLIALETCAPKKVEIPLLSTVTPTQPTSMGKKLALLLGHLMSFIKRLTLSSHPIESCGWRKHLISQIMLLHPGILVGGGFARIWVRSDRKRVRHVKPRHRG